MIVEDEENEEEAHLARHDLEVLEDGKEEDFEKEEAEKDGEEEEKDEDPLPLISQVFYNSLSK